MREFETGAIRDDDTGKIDPEAALSPLVIERYCEYVKSCRVMVNGETRSDDNWQKGFPIAKSFKSLWRHFLHAWKIHRGWCNDDIEEALCAVLFNVNCILHEILKAKIVCKNDTIVDKNTTADPNAVNPLDTHTVDAVREWSKWASIGCICPWKECVDNVDKNTTDRALDDVRSALGTAPGNPHYNVNFNHQNSCGHPGCYITSEHVHES